MNKDFNRESMDAVVSRLETVAGNMEKQLADGKATFADHEKRIRKLESLKYYLLGGAAVIALMLRAAWDWIVGNGPNIPGKH